jgi:hypothetical protein
MARTDVRMSLLSTGGDTARARREGNEGLGESATSRGGGGGGGEEKEGQEEEEQEQSGRREPG